MTPETALDTRVAPGTYTAPATGASTANRSRVTSLDIVRGLVMVLMAIDHVRVYSGVPAGGPTPGIFFTRWITHFVAPAFVFFAGTSAYLHGAKLGDRRALSRFLLVRGVWLVLLELTVLRLAWTFNLDFSQYMLAGVIWMLGWCMVLLAPLVYLRPAVVAGVGGAIVALHNLLDFAPAVGATFGAGRFSALWTVLYGGGPVSIGDRSTPFIVLYVLVPWIGVMMLGYAFGALTTLPAERRRSLTLRIGTGATIAFLLLRAADVYGDPRHWRQHPPAPGSTAATPAATTSATPNAASPATAPRRAASPPAVIRFLNTTKYPGSLLFLLMTLGPTLLLLGAVEHARGRVASVLETFGRVPLFYYLLHIPLIHAAACVVSFVRTGAVDPWLFTNHPMAPGPLPPHYMWSLGLLYLVTAVCVTALYFPCRWYARVRARSGRRWLSYL